MIWAYDLDHGVAAAEIAGREGISPSAVRRGAWRARVLTAGSEGRPAIAVARPPDPARLIPLFPARSLVPLSPCPHAGPIPPEPFICMVCHRSYDEIQPAPGADQPSG